MGRRLVTSVDDTPMASDPGVDLAADDPGSDPASTASASGTEADAGSSTGRGRRAALVLGLTAVVALPLFVALASLRNPRWYPMLDLAMTEMRVRDVGTRHTPLVGLPGRLESDGVQGSHLGPLSFWSLAPAYRLFGETGWSMFVGAVLLHTTAIGLTIWGALRRGGTVVAVAFAAGLAVLVHLYGAEVLTEPWNPYMPVLWWTLVVVSVWSVLCDDLAMLPVGVFAASFCLQTHVSYGILLAGLGLATVGFLAWRARGLRGDRRGLRRLAGWSAGAVVLGVLLWVPPLIDQASNDPGNMSIVVDHFLHSDEDPTGFGRGLELFAVNLNPWRLFAGQVSVTGSVVPGLLLVGAWAASVIAAWRLVPRDEPQRSALLRLDAVIGLLLAFGFVSSTRILGYVWDYLTLWAWATNMLVVLAIGWAAVLVLSTQRTPSSTTRRLGLAGVGAILAVWTIWFTVSASDSEPSLANYSEVLGDFTEASLDAIEEGQGPGGPDGTYLISWTDGVNLGSTGYGLVNELDRAGVDAGAVPSYELGARSHRTTDPDEATAEIHISFGPDMDHWDEVPGFERIITVDNRTDAERATYEEYRGTVIERLQADGRDDQIPLVDRAPFALWFDDTLPDEVRTLLQRMTVIGQPAAVYIGPPTSGVTSTDVEPAEGVTSVTASSPG